MYASVDYSSLRIDGTQKFELSSHPHKVSLLYENKSHYRGLIGDLRDEIDDLQNMMYAHDRYGMLLIFQAMDAAGKDGTIRHVLSGVNPHGLEIHSFKKPSTRELDHDFMWRTNRFMPQRGRIGVFNRSYYEEVLVVKVHPNILTDYQRVPRELTQNLEQVWAQRYDDIRNMELYLHRNGIRVMKFFLNLSRDEQRERFLSRLNRPEKNWKFSEADVKERQHWNKYMEAYQDCISATATEYAPWYVIPADDKKNMRLMVGTLVLEEMRKLDIRYPVVSEERKADFERYRQMLMND
ncbi:MAG: polyphosphate kinase 2 family protein [Bacteroidota bacterium]